MEVRIKEEQEMVSSICVGLASRRASRETPQMFFV
jgi:hypothetical protein